MADDNVQDKSTGKNDTNENLHFSENQFEIDADDITICNSILSEGNKYTVYEGLYKGKAVAVKKLNGSAFVDDEKEWFTRQVDILKRVNHNNIVKFIGASVKDRHWLMMVFELVKRSYGCQIYLKNRMLKDLDTVVIIAMSVSRAMEYLHSQGIIHSNLYSRNVLMALHVVKLTGFSEAIEGLVDEEQSKGLRKLDVSDFGYLLNELINSVTGCQPKVLNVNGGSSSQKDKIQESLVGLVQACLSVDPEDRPEFTLIRQNIESIFNNHTKMCKSRHDADCQVDLSAVQHHNTVESIAATSGEAPMSRMDGGTLEEYMLELKPDVPNIRTAIKIALRISKAMQKLHAQAITNVNLKSSHVVFLTKDKEFLKLGGLEHPSEEKCNEMGVEQFKSDVFNFSQILWELLTNNHTAFQAYALSKKSKRPILEGVPDQMMELLMDCASEKIEDRPDFTQITFILNKLLMQNRTAVLPKDIVIDILLRLPLKYLQRFRCVSKIWNNLLQSDEFISMHYNRRSMHYNQGSSCSSQEDKIILLKTAYPHKLNKGKLHNVLSFHSTDGNLTKLAPHWIVPDFDSHAEVLGPVRGIICVTDYRKFGLLNPATRQFKLLSDSSFATWDCSDCCTLGAGFGFDSHFKIIRIMGFYSDLLNLKVELYSLKTECWRRLDINVACVIHRPNSEIFFNGACHWYAYDNRKYIILAFNLCSELFEKLDIPNHELLEDLRCECLKEINGYLSLVTYPDYEYFTFSCVIDVWKMTIYGDGDSWVRLFHLRTFNDIKCPLSFWMDKFLFVENDFGGLELFDLTNEDNRKRFPMIVGAEGSLRLLDYKPSLVSINNTSNFSRIVFM